MRKRRTDTICTVSPWCNGSTSVSKTVGESSSLSGDAKQFASIAQKVERCVEGAGVRGSIPRRCTIFRRVAKWLRHRVLIPTCEGSTPSPSANQYFLPRWLMETGTPTVFRSRAIAGSNPAWGTTNFNLGRATGRGFPLQGRCLVEFNSPTVHH